MAENNIRFNHLDKSITLFNLGVGSTQGDKVLFLSEQNTGGHSIYGHKDQKQKKIRIVSLKDIFTENNLATCSFLKLDCEGAEFEILYSTNEEILKRIKTITLEFHESPGTRSVEELRAFLERNGFQCFVNMEVPRLGYLYAEAREWTSEDFTR